jgi:hypothetical protein
VPSAAGALARALIFFTLWINVLCRRIRARAGAHAALGKWLNGLLDDFRNLTSDVFFRCRLSQLA